jgi:hypothetical protein
VPLDINSLSLLVFTDASFANNKDLSSQIGFVIILTDRNQSVNVLHYGGPGKKSPDYRASDAEGTLKHRIKIAHTR